jgi:PAS domain S-box-containing protein
MTAERPGSAKAAFAELLADASRDALIALSLDGTVSCWSRGAEAMFGYTAEAAVGQPIEALIVPQEHQAEALRARAAVVETGAAVMESVRRHRGGSLIQVNVSMRRIDVPGAGPCIVVSTQDITELKRLRDEQQRMRDGNGLNSGFLASMAHELRSPLNAIIGFAELMHRGKVGPVSPQHQEYLGDILTSSNHLLQLVNDVLDLAKVESGTMVFRPEAIDLMKLVGEVRDVLRELAASRKLQVETEADPEFSSGAVSVVVDPARVKQVLYNFLSNAMKFTPDTGRITIRVLGEGPDLFRLSVMDTGIGVPPEDLDKLFLDFQQIDAHAARRYQGTALGLALTKKIVEAHGGRVEVTSISGTGSTFSAVLPRGVAAPRLEARGADGRIATPLDTNVPPRLASRQ